MLTWAMVEKLAFGLGCVLAGMQISKYFQMKDGDDDDHHDK